MRNLVVTKVVFMENRIIICQDSAQLNGGVFLFLYEQGKKVYQIQYHPRTSSTQIKKNIITQFQKDTQK
jgi:anthranilate/para-aminobenzoate synthase component II